MKGDYYNGRFDVSTNVGYCFRSLLVWVIC